MTSNDISRPIDPQVRIGHVHLKVADLERSLRFYCGVLGFELTQRYGTQAAFVSAGSYHHHIGLNTWESLGGSPPPPGATGLYHVAILYPTRRALADALQRLIAAGIPLDGASDHGVSEALYLRDPDDNVCQGVINDDPKSHPRHQGHDVEQQHAADFIPVPDGLAEQAIRSGVIALLRLAGGFPDPADGAASQADHPGDHHGAEEGMDLGAKRDGQGV